MSALTQPSGKPSAPNPGSRWRTVLARTVEIIVLLLVAAFLFLALRGEHPNTTEIARGIIERATEETGALNLVTAIYLEYRLFDTLGETIVLLLAVSGVIVFLELRK